MKKIFSIIVVAALLISMTSCMFLNNPYKKGVDYSDFPDRDLDIYDDAIVFTFKGDEDESEIEYGTKDDVDDVAEFYQELFEDDEYIIMEENTSDKDEYFVSGYIDDLYFEITVEEAKGEEADYFDTVVEISVEKGEAIPILLTPIGAFSYTQEFTSSFDQLATKSGYTLLIIKFTPLNNQKSSADSNKQFSMMDTQAVIGGDTFSPSLLQTTYGTNGAVPQFILAFAVPEDKTSYTAKVVLADSVEFDKQENEESEDEVIDENLTEEHEVIEEKVDNPIDITFIQTSSSSWFENTVLATMEAELGQLYYELEILNSEFDVDTQITILMQSIESYDDVVVVFPLVTSSDMWETVVDEAVKNDVRIIFVLNYPEFLDINNLPDGIFVIDMDSDTVGTMQAEYAIDILDNSSNIAIFKNEMELPFLDQRSSSCMEELMNAGISIDEPIVFGWDRAEIAAVVTQWIESGMCDDADAIIVNFDYLATMVAETLIAEGVTDKIVISADGQKDFLDLIRQGYPYATFSVNYIEIGSILGYMIDEIADGNIDLPVRTMEYELITAENADDY